MIRSFARMVATGAVACGALLGAQAASATVFTFTSSNATANPGYSLSYPQGGTSTGGLTLNVYGYHLNDGTGANQGASNSYTTATAETYQNYGLGVLFGSDTDRDSSGTHQIDNVGDGVDFVALVFNQSVTLNTIDRQAYGITIPGSSTKSSDTDAAFRAYTYGDVLSDNSFTQLASGVTATGSTASSNIWLVAASTLGFDRNDAFKITDIKVTTAGSPAAVPEPATWATLIVGMGAIGGTMRRRKGQGTSRLAA